MITSEGHCCPAITYSKRYGGRDLQGWWCIRGAGVAIPGVDSERVGLAHRIRGRYITRSGSPVQRQVFFVLSTSAASTAGSGAAALMPPHLWTFEQAKERIGHETSRGRGG
jgi:hypothetical protein